MFKHITVILLMIAFVIQTFSSGFIMLNYYTGTGSYAKNCVNKARPALHCNGKCQMMKKLKQEESRDKQNPERKNAGKEEVLYLAMEQYKPAIPFSQITNSYSPFNTKSAGEIAFDFFQPPRV